MRISFTRTLAGTAAGVAALSLALVAAPATAQVDPDRGGADCTETHAGSAARGVDGRGADHRDISAAERRAIERRTDRILAAQGDTVSAAAASVPVYVHVMAGKNGEGDVPRSQINRQISVLNKTFAGEESGEAAATGFSFTLAGVDRYYNNTWHKDGASANYRAATRQGGANALNMWLVDFKYLGIATFPWDYSKHGRIDGIRVHYDSLPGGSIANYNLGETATHEAGHWFGLYHTFQGGCTATNDEVGDTPAQSSPTNGCPEGRDSCSLPGLDPIHNYMDYSYDSCYNQFSAGQSTRMSEMFAAYRS